MNKNKLYLSILVVIVSFLTLGTVSYAWFTVGLKSDIQPFEVQATSGGDNMEISLSIGDLKEDAYWGPLITSEQISSLINEKYNNNPQAKELKLNAVTSKDGINFYNFKNGLFNPNKLSDNDGEYLSFRIYFRSNVETNISWTKAELTSSGEILDSGHTGWIDVDGTNILVPTATTHHIHHAARISVSSIGYDTIAYEHHLDDGIDSRNIILGDATSLQTNGYWGAHSFFASTTGTTLNLSNIEVIDTQNINDTKPVVTRLTNKVGAYYMNYITVNVWLEGWDQNTFDGLLKATLSISLGFERV